MSHRDKYYKYKTKYLKLKKQLGGEKYKFYYSDDKEKENEFGEFNKRRIKEMYNTCFPPNLQHFVHYANPGYYKKVEERVNQKELEYNENINEMVRDYWTQEDYLLENTELSKFANRFYVLDEDDIIVGYCRTTEQGFAKFTPEEVSRIGTYTLFFGDYEKDKGAEIYNIIMKPEEKIYPVIVDLCKDCFNKNVGSFLLTNVCDYFKKNNINRIYLVPMSSKYVANALSCISHYSFVVVEKYRDKFRDSSLKLIKYYENNGFKVSNDLFYIQDISCEPYPTGIYLLNVMYRDL
jgi:hypothetical protein